VAHVVIRRESSQFPLCHPERRGRHGDRQVEGPQ